MGAGDSQLMAAFCFSQDLEGKQGSQAHLAGVALAAAEGLGPAGAPHIALPSLQGSSAWAGSILSSRGALGQSLRASLPWHGAWGLLNHAHCCWGFSAVLCFPGRETEAQSKEAAEDSVQACA